MSRPFSRLLGASRLFYRDGAHPPRTRDPPGGAKGRLFLGAPLRMWRIRCPSEFYGAASSGFCHPLPDRGNGRGGYGSCLPTRGYGEHTLLRHMGGIYGREIARICDCPTGTYSARVDSRPRRVNDWRPNFGLLGAYYIGRGLAQLAACRLAEAAVWKYSEPGATYGGISEFPKNALTRGRCGYLVTGHTRGILIWLIYAWG